MLCRAMRRGKLPSWVIKLRQVQLLLIVVRNDEMKIREDAADNLIPLARSLTLSLSRYMPGSVYTGHRAD